MDYNKDKEFDDFFSKGFEENSLQIKPDSKEWDSLAKRLDHHQEKKSTGAFPWLWLLLPLMFLLQAWSLYDNYTMKNLIADYQSIENTRAIEKTKFYDTVYQNVSHIIYDTIYKTVLIRQLLNNHTSENYQNLKTDFLAESISKKSILPSTQNPGAIVDITENETHKKKVIEGSSPGLKIENEINFAHQYKENSGFISNNIPDAVENGGKKLSNPDDVASTTRAVKNDSTEYKTSTSYEKKAQEVEDRPRIQSKEQTEKEADVPQAKEKTLADFMANQKRPSAFQQWVNEITENNTENYWRFGVNTGLFLPIVRGEIDITSPFSTGIFGEWVIGKHISILPAVSYNQFFYDAERPFFERLGIPEPPQALPGTTFTEAEALYKVILPSLQIRYRFVPQKKWSWYAGAGYAAGFGLRSDIAFEYLDPNLNESFQYINNHKTINRLVYLNTHLGTQYHITDNLTIHADLPVYFDLRSASKGMHLFAPSLGIKFFPKK
jgi:hypothetical protein